MRTYIFLFAAALAAQTNPVEDPQEIVRRAFFKDADLLNATRDYTYWQRRVVTELEKDGGKKVTKDETEEIMILYGRPYSRLIRKDGRELSTREAAREEQKLNKEAAQRKKDTGKAGSREDKEAAERRRAIEEVSDAYLFQLVGVEPIQNRESWIIDATPRPSFKPRSRQAAFYPKLSGRLWIDCAAGRLVKVKADVNEKISFGWILLQLLPGAIFEHERILVDDQVWLPKRDLAFGSAKIGGIKTIRAEVETTYSNYRRFKVESIMGVFD